MSASKNEMTSWDTRNYIKAYNMASPISEFTLNQVFYFEPGYMLIQSLCKQLTKSPTLLFSLISIISIGLYGLLIWRYSPYPFLSIFIYFCVFFYTNEMIIIRYGCSTAIMLLSLIKLADGKIFKSILWAVVSSLFHYTALSYIILIFFFLVIKKLKIMEYITYIAFPFAIIGITGFQLADFIFRSNILLSYFQTALSKGIQYVNIEEAYGYKRILMYLPVIFFYKQCSKSHILKNNYFIILFALFMMIELSQASTLGRIGQMYISIIIVFVPMILSNINQRYYQILYIYIIGYTLYMFIRISFLHSGELNFIW
jgi:hypothetical protein